MMLLNISKSLVKPLARHLRPAKRLQPSLLWRADLAVIGVQLAIVAEEQHSGYRFVLCGLDAEEFANFPEVLAERLWREVASICLQAEIYDQQTLAQYLKPVLTEQYYQLDPEPMKEGPISKTLEKLEREFLYKSQPLPVDGKSAFEFSFELNSRHPKDERGEAMPSAAERLGTLCLALVEQQIELEKEANNPVISTQNNIVKVDFARNRH